MRVRRALIAHVSTTSLAKSSTLRILVALQLRGECTAVHKIDIAQQAIDISMRRRGAVQPFATIEPEKTALLVVDMQTGFVAPGGVAEIPVAREIVPNINRLAEALRRAGGTVVWILSTYGPGAERDWTTFFNFVLTGETSDRFRLAFQEGKPEHTLWRELDYRRMILLFRRTV